MMTVLFIAMAPSVPALKCLVSYLSLGHSLKGKPLKWLALTLHSVLLVFVFRGHWKSWDSTNGQCCYGNTQNEQKCCGYHCHLPGKVNATEIYVHTQMIKHLFPLNKCNYFPLYLSLAFPKRCAVWFWMRSAWGRFTQRATWWSLPKSANWFYTTSSMTLVSIASTCRWPMMSA